MAGKDRATAADLGGHLEQEANRYAFFQAVELIQNRLDGGREVGTHDLAADEKVFFEVVHNLAFPLSDVVSIKRLSHDEARGNDASASRFKMSVSFLGLHGSGSPLPSYYAERIAQYDAEGSVIKGFLDFFHNRVIGLLHRSWRKFRYYRRYKPGGEDKFSSWIFSLFGLGDAKTRAETNIYWPRLLCFAGMLSTRNRSPAMLSAVIAHAFNLDAVEIEEWVKRKVPIAADQITRLGQMNSALGQSFILGDRTPDVQGKIRIVIRNLTFERFQDFLPHGKDFKPLRGLVEFMLRDQLAYDLKLGLLPREAHPLTLRSDSASRLGWSSFLGDRRFEEMRDVIIQVRS
ncbi:type VI secretion system baseplate subunit TssG [Phyllobacterium leguminum]|uniref:Type VI secretion system protein ImpH n=1 Tax=Phyllobacterium leguminum TaxID=314237 RepID=A0A318SUW6_9HYPH|nr:type VI secretion system baseplate subunit TssG [Phyllobacterium leguminum]PYE85282.1 type VI secretion system protein ImpH [Phyllobacterium leguminum]